MGETEETKDVETTEKTVVLVTGGSGLVGMAIKDYIDLTGAKEGETWVFLNSKMGDLRKREDCNKIFEEYQPTHVIHLAAKVGGLFANMAQKVEFFRENILINDNIMECSRVYKVKKLVSFLSTCIFPDKTTYPIDETMLHDGPPHPSNEGYAYAKRLIDTMNRAYAEEYGCTLTLLDMYDCVVFVWGGWNAQPTDEIMSLDTQLFVGLFSNEPFFVPIVSVFLTSFFTMLPPSLSNSL